MKIAVLGIGNILLSDDGAGVHAVRALKKRHLFSQNIDIVDGGTMGLDLLPYIEGKDKVIIIDAVDFGEKAGTIKTIGSGDIPAFLSTRLSAHQIGLQDMIFVAHLVAIRTSEMSLIGIQPKCLSTGLEMSPEIKDKFEELLDRVIDKLKQWGAEIKDNVPCNTV